MIEFITEFDLDDAVYYATNYSCERDIVNAIKITKKGTYYGFEVKDSSFLFIYHSDGYLWIPEHQVYNDKEPAEREHARLAAEKEREDAKRHGKEREARIIKLKAELEAAEKGVELEEVDYED